MTEATGRILESVNFEYYTLSGTLLFVSSIFNFGATGEILKAVEELYGRAITRRIISLHLEALEKQKKIERDPFVKAGIPRFYRLNKNAKLSLELELPVKVQSKREENARHSSSKKNNMLLRETKEQRNKKVYLLLMSLVAIGFSVPEPVKDKSEIGAGDIFIRNKPYRSSTKIVH